VQQVGHYRLQHYAHTASGQEARTPTDTRPKPWQRLTERQLEVLRHLVHGSTIAETADALDLTEKAIEFHRRRIKKLLGVSTTAGLIHYTVSHRVFD